VWLRLCLESDFCSRFKKMIVVLNDALVAVRGSELIEELDFGYFFECSSSLE
jgi:hypothetical protein